MTVTSGSFMGVKIKEFLRGVFHYHCISTHGACFNQVQETWLEQYVNGR
jgi:hypothetical protein